MPGRRETSAQRTGRSAEESACRYLEAEGLVLVTRNYRCRWGEIDIVMHDGATVVFVEVRQRRTDDFGTPAETVTAGKQARLRTTAEHYLQNYQKESQKPCRFDIVAINGSDQRIDWLRDAF